MQKHATVDQMNEVKTVNGYQVFSDGRVLGPRGRFLKLSKAACGYVNVNMWNNYEQTTYLLHRLVATLFIPNPMNYPEVNHKDGNKLNNAASNLEWVTRSKNIQHAYKSGLNKGAWTGKSGAAHFKSKSVIQYDLEGNEIRRFGSSREAEKIMGIRSIGDVLRGRNKTAGGFIWKYA